MIKNGQERIWKSKTNKDQWFSYVITNEHYDDSHAEIKIIRAGRDSTARTGVTYVFGKTEMAKDKIINATIEEGTSEFTSFNGKTIKIEVKKI